MQEATPHAPQQHIIRELSRAVANLYPHQISELLVTGLCASWKQRHAPATYFWKVHGLRRALRQFQMLTGVQHLTAAVPRVHQPPPRSVIASADEINRLWNTASPRERVWLCLTLRLGLRHGDALSIGPEHYDAETKTLRWTQQKTGELQTLPVADDIALLFEEAPDFGDPAMPYFARWNHGKRVKTGATRRMWERLKNRAGVRREVTAHDLRRTVAVATHEVTKDVLIVQQLLGHRSLNATLHYLPQKTPDALRPILAQLWKPITEVKQ